MMDSSKYRVGYFPVDKKYNKWVAKDHVEKPPVWCSVDMRDGNQSLVIPMSLEEKLEYYKVLLAVGFKEIEVGFPAASETEYEFLRTLIDNNMIPEDVTVQVLTQCREHIIRKTFDACKGAPSAIIHFYNSVSVAQREQVFKKSKEEIKQIAVDGAKLVKKLASEYEGNFRFEYSPESFTGTEPEYALEVCNNADVIVSLGVRFNDRVTGNRTKFATGAKIVHIDVDGSELNKTVNSVCGLRGDVKLTLQKLLPLLNEGTKPEWMAKVNAFRAEEETYLDNREGLTPRRAILTLNKHLGENTAVCTDVGQHQMWSAQNLNFKTTRRFASSGGLGTMGYGFGAAIGAAYGTGERSVLVTGDGSFGMNLNELATAVRYNVPVVVIIMNNGVLGMVRQWQTLFYDKHYSNSVLERKTDFAAFAKAFGADGEAVTTPEELDEALGRAFKTDGPYIIDCKIDKDEFVLPMLPPNGSMDDIITKLEVEL